jgi:hypothetical protein
MCERCKSIDREIGHYRDIAARVTDAQTLKGIDLLIERMEPKSVNFTRKDGREVPKFPPLVRV